MLSWSSWRGLTRPLLGWTTFRSEGGGAFRRTFPEQINGAFPRTGSARYTIIGSYMVSSRHSLLHPRCLRHGIRGGRLNAESGGHFGPRYCTLREVRVKVHTVCSLLHPHQRRPFTCERIHMHSLTRFDCFGAGMLTCFLGVSGQRGRACDTGLRHASFEHIWRCKGAHLL